MFQAPENYQSTYDFWYDEYRKQFGREAVCNHRELDGILSMTTDVGSNAIINAMTFYVGSIGTPRRSR